MGKSKVSQGRYLNVKGRARLSASRRALRNVEKSRDLDFPIDVKAHWRRNAREAIRFNLKSEADMLVHFRRAQISVVGREAQIRSEGTPGAEGFTFASAEAGSG